MAVQKHQFIRQDLLELAAAYAEYSVIITTAQLDEPGPQFLYANSAFTRMTGYSVLDLLGKTPRLLQGPETDRATLRKLRAALSAGEDFIARAINYKRDGAPFELEWIISHLKDSSGRTTHYVALQRDITGQSRAEEELVGFDEELRNASERFAETLSQLECAEQKVEERERMAMLGDMAEGVVHDISNAITPVFSMVQLLHSLDNLPKIAADSIVTLAANTQHAVDLLANLKQYYRTSRTAPVRKKISLQPLLESIPDLARPRWWSPERQSRAPITFELDIAESATVLGNETQLMQVLINLVNNAIEAMPTGGQIKIQLSSNGSDVFVSVSDTGTGMSDEEMQRCFVQYYTTREHGTGLGLSVCRKIVEDHGGRIEVARNTPRGTTFTVCLPTFESAEQRKTNRTTEGSSVRILHIDSDHTREETLSSILRPTWTRSRRCIERRRRTAQVLPS